MHWSCSNPHPLFGSSHSRSLSSAFPLSLLFVLQYLYPLLPLPCGCISLNNCRRSERRALLGEMLPLDLEYKFRLFTFPSSTQEISSTRSTLPPRMLHSDYVSFEEPATSDSARLPPHLQRTILDFFFSSLRDLGGAVSIHRRKLLSPIQLVSSRWNSYTKHQFEIYPYFDFREPEIDYEEIDDCLRNRKLMRCICHGEGILSISFNNSEEKSLAGRKKCWKKTLERVVKQFSHLEQLNLWLADDGCGENHELAYRFPRERSFPLAFRCQAYDALTLIRARSSEAVYQQYLSYQRC